MRKLFKILLVLLVLTLFVVGCSNTADNDKQLSNNDQTEENDNVDQKDNDDQKDDSDVDLEREIKSNILFNIMNADTYTIKMKSIITFDNNSMETLVTNVVSGDKVYSIAESAGIIMEYIEKDDDLYLIMKDSKTVIKTNRYEDEDGEKDNPGIIYDDLKYIGSGKEEFMGKNMAFEEYEVEVGTAKYYIEGKELKGMKMNFNMDAFDDEDDDEDESIFDSGEVEMTIEVISYEEKADASFFEIPEGYKVVGQ